jgi:hypothetical protein
MDDYATILTIIVGNGALIAVFTILFNYFNQKSQTNIEARKDAHEFYMRLYGKLLYTTDLIAALIGARAEYRDKPEKVFIKEKGYSELSIDEIENYFSEAVNDFLNYYTAKRCEGYEIFLPLKLRNLLEDYCEHLNESDWKGKPGVLSATTLRYLTKMSIIANEIDKQMEKLFGLK